MSDMTTALPREPHAAMPAYFRLARALSMLLAGLPGEYFFYRQLRRLGLLNRLARFDFFDGHIYLPIHIPETLHIHDFSLYHGLRETNFANVLMRSLGGFTFIDCGAAFGQVSCRMAKLCQNLEEIIAIEPNAASFQALELNLRLLRRPLVWAVRAAVADFRGNGELCFPRGGHDPHAAYLRPAPDGGIEVIRIDDIPGLTGRDLAIKLDVEGGELAAIRGAARTIAHAGNLCFMVELHPEVLARNHTRAEDLLMAINRIRPTRWIVAHAPLTVIDPARPVFEQVPVGIHDVIGISSAR